MPRPALTLEQMKKVRNDIREAALRLRTRHGSSEITVRAVAAEAGISVGTFYTYYENLTELGQALWQEPVGELRRKVESAAKRNKDPLKRIRKMLECYAKFEEEQRMVFQGAFLFIRPATMSKPEQVSLEQEMFFRLLRDSIVEGQELGLIRDGKPAEMAQILWASIHGALALPTNLDRYKFDQSQKMAKNMIRFLIDSISS